MARGAAVKADSHTKWATRCSMGLVMLDISLNERLFSPTALTATA